MILTAKESIGWKNLVMHHFFDRVKRRFFMGYTFNKIPHSIFLFCWETASFWFDSSKISFGDYFHTFPSSSFEVFEEKNYYHPTIARLVGNSKIQNFSRNIWVYGKFNNNVRIFVPCLLIHICAQTRNFNSTEIFSNKIYRRFVNLKFYITTEYANITLCEGKMANVIKMKNGRRKNDWLVKCDTPKLII